jgi:hypothetical protein
MAFGIQTWDANGKPNNYGLVPVSVVGFFHVAQNQQSGSATYTVPAGFVMDILQAFAGESYTNTRRKVTVSGGSITIGAAGDADFGADTYPALAGHIIAFLRAA